MALFALDRVLRHKGSAVLQLAKPIHHGQTQLVVVVLLLNHLRHQHGADLGWEASWLGGHLLC